MKMKQFDTASTQRLYTAIDNNDVREFQAMTDAGYPVATASFGGEEWEKTSLMMLVDKPNASLASVKKLIQLGSRLDAVDSYNSTPLHIAASNPDNDPKVQATILAYLVRKSDTLEGNCNLVSVDKDGNTPLDSAIKLRTSDNGRHKDTSDLFRKAIADAEIYVSIVQRETQEAGGSQAHKIKVFNEHMERDDLYVLALGPKRAKEAGFAAREDQRRAGQTTANPIMVSLVANEGGFTGAVLKQQEEKKKQKCCIIT